MAPFRRTNKSSDNIERGPGYNIWIRLIYAEQLKVGDILLRQVISIDQTFDFSPFGWITGIGDVNRGLKVEYQDLFNGTRNSVLYETDLEQVFVIRNFAE